MESLIEAEVTSPRNPRVLLVNSTRWACPARLALGLMRSGCEISAACPSHHPVATIRGIEAIYPYSAFSPLQSLAQAITTSRADMVIPFDDRATFHLHDLWARAREFDGSGKLADLIERSLGSATGYPIVSSRFQLLKVAIDAQVRVPETRAVDSAHDLNSWRANLDFPWVLKADGTFGGSGVSIVRSLPEALRAYSEATSMYNGVRAIKRWLVNRDPFWFSPYWNNVKPGVIVQAFVDGRPANSAVFCFGGEVLASIEVEALGTEGTTGPADTIRVVDNPTMSECARRIARRLGLSGFFGFDFLLGKDGEVYLIEMNPRCTPLCHLQLGGGRDLVAVCWSVLSGRPIRELPPVTLNEQICYFPNALRGKSPLLESSFHDMPNDQPALVEELLRPWVTRTLAYRLYAYKERFLRRRRMT
ncbi:MAG: ATP-grasp domain-containing protein [Burkholderiales bacterium]